MSDGAWERVKEKELSDGFRVRLYRSRANPALYRRDTQRSHAVPYKLRSRGSVWSVVEYCERLEDGTLTPWRSKFAWPDIVSQSASSEAAGSDDRFSY